MNEAADSSAPRMLVNGQPGRRLSALDRGLQYGDGLFETIRVEQGRLCWFERHMARLTLGCERLGVALPDTDLLRSEAESLVRGMPRALVKIIVTRGVATARGYRPSGDELPTRIVTAYDWPAAPGAEFRVGLSTVPVNTNPLLAGLKHLNRLEQVLAQRSAAAANLHEALMCDERGQVVCGSMSNLFLLQGDDLLTSPDDACGVAGIMRSLLVEIAPRLGLRVRYAALAVAQLAAARAIILTNVRLGAQPVHWYEGRKLEVDARMSLMQELIDGSAA